MVKNNYCTIYVVRHGETEANLKGILQGHKDFPLTKKGINQAQTLAKKLSKIKFDEAFSSDLLRAHRTAKIIALEHKLIVKTTEKLRERGFGHYEGKVYSVINNDLKKMFEEYEKLSSEEKFKYKFKPFIESDEELSRRMILFLREISVAYPGKKILVVAHGSIMRSVLIALGFALEEELELGAIKNLGYFKLESDGVDFFIKETEGIKKNSIAEYTTLQGL